MRCLAFARPTTPASRSISVLLVLSPYQPIWLSIIFFVRSALRVQSSREQPSANPRTRATHAWVSRLQTYAGFPVELRSDSATLRADRPKPCRCSGLCLVITPLRAGLGGSAPPVPLSGLPVPMVTNRPPDRSVRAAHFHNWLLPKVVTRNCWSGVYESVQKLVRSISSDRPDLRQGYTVCSIRWSVPARRCCPDAFAVTRGAPYPPLSTKGYGSKPICRRSLSRCAMLRRACLPSWKSGKRSSGMPHIKEGCIVVTAGSRGIGAN